MNAIILLGAPGAGKGTAAEHLRESSKFVHVSTGDMLREAIREGSEIGKKAEGFMKRGALVPDNVVVRFVEGRLGQGGKAASYMFDGFPRTEAQAVLLEETLAKLGGSVDRVYYLEASRDVLLARLTGRRVCRACGANYHLTNIPPRQDGVCDACGGELYQRPDDMEDTITNRLDVFEQQTEKLISHYEDQGLLKRVDAEVAVYALVSEILRDLGTGMS